MADEQNAGFWSVIAAGITAIASIIINVTRGAQPNANNLLYKANKESLDGLREDLEHVRAEYRAAQEERDQWERAARGMDELARDFWHIICNNVQNGKLTIPVPPRVPKLEDFF